jgi:hypothetical protein
VKPGANTSTVLEIVHNGAGLRGKANTICYFYYRYSLVSPRQAMCERIQVRLVFLVDLAKKWDDELATLSLVCGRKVFCFCLLLLSPYTRQGAERD